jgi:hypothetical protein
MKVGELCDFEYGKALKESDRVEGIYPVMGSNGRVGFHNSYFAKGPCIKVTNQKLPKFRPLWIVRRNAKSEYWKNI